jgi:hypothetical protein
VQGADTVPRVQGARLTRRGALLACAAALTFASAAEAYPRLASLVPAGGDRLVVQFDAGAGDLASERVYATTGTLSGGFLDPRPLTNFAVGPNRPHLTTVPDGSVLAIFSQEHRYPTGDPEDPDYDGSSAIWATTIAPDGVVAPARRLAQNAAHGLGEPQVASLPDGSTAIAWYSPAPVMDNLPGGGQVTSWIVRRSPGGVWGAPRRLGPDGFAVTSLIVLDSGRLFAIGDDRRGLVSLVRGRKLVHIDGRRRAFSPGAVAVSRPGPGAAVAWNSNGHLRVARISGAGRVIGTATLTDYADGHPRIGIDGAGRTLVLFEALQELRIVALSPRGKIVRSSVLEKLGMLRLVADFELAVDALGGAAATWELVPSHNDVPPSRLAFGDTRGAYQPFQTFGGRSLQFRLASLAVDPSRGFLICWTETTDRVHGTVWAQHRDSADAGSPVAIASQ